MDVSQQGLDAIKNSEGCKLEAYQDEKGIWTIGFGQTGESVVEGLTWTQEEADDSIAATVAGHSTALSNELTGATTQGQFDAMVNLSYNIGKYALATSTVLRKHNLKAFKEAAAAFMMWNKLTIHGLLTYSEGQNNRRLREKAMYLS